MRRNDSSELHHQQFSTNTHATLSTTGAPPDSSLVYSIVVINIPVPLLFQSAWPDGSAMLLHRVTPEAELLVGFFLARRN
jgi:hypothetical protein